MESWYGCKFQKQSNDSEIYFDPMDIMSNFVMTVVIAVVLVMMFS